MILEPLLLLLERIRDGLLVRDVLREYCLFHRPTEGVR